MKAIPTLLAEIPELAIEVQKTAGVGAPNPTVRPQIRRPQPGSRPPLDLGVIDLMRADPLEDLIIGAGDATSHLIDRLGMCVRMVAEERELVGLSMPEPQFGTFSGTCAYLASTSGWWLSEAGLSEDVSRETRKVWKALADVAKVREEYHPHCRDCGWRLDSMDGGTWYSCSGCGRDYTLDADIKALGQIQTAPLSEVAQVIDVPVKTLHRWVKAGLLAPEPEKRGNANVFHIDAARKVADRMRHAG